MLPFFPNSKGSTYMGLIKKKAKAAYTTFSLFITLTITISIFQPRVVNFKCDNITEHNTNQPVSKMTIQTLFNILKTKQLTLCTLLLHIHNCTDLMCSSYALSFVWVVAEFIVIFAAMDLLAKWFAADAVLVWSRRADCDVMQHFASRYAVVDLTRSRLTCHTTRNQRFHFSTSVVIIHRSRASSAMRTLRFSTAFRCFSKRNK
jgi:hypothetical protein